MSQWVKCSDQIPPLFEGCTCDDCGGGPITWSDCVIVCDPHGQEIRVTYQHDEQRWWLSQNGRYLDFTPTEWRETENGQ